jgi:hypothetical protein
MDSISHLRQSIALFFGHHPWCFFERKWVRYTLAPDVGLGGFGGSHDSHEFSSISKETEMISKFGVISWEYQIAESSKLKAKPCLWQNALSFEL